MVKFFLLSFFVFFIFIFMIISPELYCSGAVIGVKISLDTLIPSLFPFIMLSTFAVKSSLAEKLGNKLDNPIKKLFNLPGFTACTILLGLLGGYPSGAKGTASLYQEKKISKKEAEIMCLFLVNAGPAFIMSVVSSKTLQNKKIGFILLSSQILGSIILGIFLGLFIKKENKIKNTSSNSCKSLSDALVESCIDAFYGTLNICAFVIIFSAFLGIIKNFFPPWPALILEITSGCSTAIPFGISLEVICFFISWAGICVHFQIYSLVKTIKISKLKFITARILHGIISSILCHLLLKIFPQAQYVINPKIEKLEPAISSSFLGSAALLISCVSLILCLPKNIICNKDAKNKAT